MYNTIDNVEFSAKSKKTEQFNPKVAENTLKAI